MGPEGLAARATACSQFAPSGNFKQPWLLGAQTGKKQAVNGKQCMGERRALCVRPRTCRWSCQDLSLRLRLLPGAPGNSAGPTHQAPGGLEAPPGAQAGRLPPPAPISISLMTPTSSLRRFLSAWLRSLDSVWDTEERWGTAWDGAESALSLPPCPHQDFSSVCGVCKF